MWDRQEKTGVNDIQVFILKASISESQMRKVKYLDLRDRITDHCMHTALSLTW